MLIYPFSCHLHKTNIVLYIKCLRKLHYISKKCQKEQSNYNIKTNDKYKYMGNIFNHKNTVYDI